MPKSRLEAACKIALQDDEFVGEMKTIHEKLKHNTFTNMLNLAASYRGWLLGRYGPEEAKRLLTLAINRQKKE